MAVDPHRKTIQACGEVEPTEDRLHPAHGILNRQGKQKLLSTFARLNKSFQRTPSPWALDVLTKSVVGRRDVLSIRCPAFTMADPQPWDATCHRFSALLVMGTPATSVFEIKLLTSSIFTVLMSASH